MRILAITLFTAAFTVCAYNFLASWRQDDAIECIPDCPALPETTGCACPALPECNTTTPPTPLSPITAEDETPTGDARLYSPEGYGDARLYSPEGYGEGHLALLPDKRLAPLTKWIQAYIHRHQHPERCDRLLVSDGHLSGFGSEMHVIGAHLAYAIQHHYVLLLSPNTCSHFRVPHACADGCACMMRPVSNCTNATDDPLLPRIQGEQHMAEQLADVFVAALQADFPSMTLPQIKYWWRGQSAAYLMRFNDHTLRSIRALRHDPALHYTTDGRALPFPLPPNTISAHIRGGDKRAEMPLVPAHTFAAAVFQLVDRMPQSFSRTVFVSGDDPQTIDEARRLIEDRRMTFVYTRMPRLVGGHTLRDWQSVPEGSFYAHLLQLLMALEADAWIGTRGSNWNRLIDELRCVWVDKCPGVYVEVGSIPEHQYSW